MDKIFDFKKYSQRLNEMGIYNNVDRFDTYLNDINDSKKFLKSFTNEINNLKEIISNLDMNDIHFINFYKNDENFDVRFKDKNLRDFFMNFIHFMDNIKIKNDEIYDFIINKYFNGDSDFTFNFHIQIDRDNWNKFHFPIDLPEFMKGFGLGKKIIQAALKKFDYLLFSDFNDSLELKLSIDKLTKRKDIFTFIKKHFILLIDGSKSELVKEIIPRWKNGDEIIMDEDFIEQYGDIKF